ncbi:MAG: ribonuclease HII [Gammaproteobacteria bacterium]
MIAGVDEAGRGPLAGPVYAAAVILDPANPIEGLTDSKKISDKKRRLLFDEITTKSLSYGVGRAEAFEIDEINILQATFLAMERAVSQLKFKPDQVWIDGNQAPKMNYTIKTIIGGDKTIAAISAASILAKVLRDDEMLLLDERYPDYGFSKHKGYGTKLHLERLAQFGPCEIHRRSFAPVRNAEREKVCE